MADRDRFETDGAAGDGYPTYYDQPAIRSGHWGWLIISYFWCGGIAGGSYLLAAVANLFGREEDREIARWGRYVAFLFGPILSPIFLILDLGRPERFLNMLRIFKPRSAMSAGSWGLSLFGLFSALSTAHQAAGEGRLGPLGAVARWLPLKLIEAVGAFFGLFMGGYTGVLISQTAVPFWARNHRTNGPVFLCSALATASAAISFLLALTGRGSRASERKLHRTQQGALLAEGALLAYELRHLGPLGRPLTHGRGSRFFYPALVGGIILPLLSGLPKSRLLTALRAGLVLAGGFLLRAAIIFAGKESGAQAEDYFRYTDPGQA